MPKDLTQLISKPIEKKSYKASYFHKNLTGSGGARGLLNKDKNNVYENFKMHTHSDTMKSNNSYYTYKDQITKRTRYTDLSPKTDIVLTNSDVDLYANNTDDDSAKISYDDNYNAEIHEYDTSILNNVLKVLENYLNHGYNYVKVYNNQVPYILQKMKTVHLKGNCSFGLSINHITHISAKNGEKIDDRDIYIARYTSVYKFKSNNNSKHTKIWMLTDSDVEDLMVVKNHDILKTINKEKNINHILIINCKTSFNADNQAFLYMNKTHENALKKLNISEILNTQAELTDKHLIDDFVNSLRLLKIKDIQDLNIVEYIMTRSYHLFENAKKSLTEKEYKKWYMRLKKYCLQNHKNVYTQYYFDRLLSINTRLSLTHQLNVLDENKNVYKFEPKSTKIKDQTPYSLEQLAIIETTSPYSVGVAGAGSGKSHTLIGRLEFLKQNNINLKNVLVTSFTNVAANNILKRFNGSINSLTNANLFHNIYQENFDHVLTEDATLVNTLNILSESSKLMQQSPTIIDTKNQLQKTLSKLTKNGYQRVDTKQVTEELIYLLQNNYDDVINILNALKQTTLTLEPIILSTMLKNKNDVKYPEKLKNLNFIITDESQDTSSFEYILLLQLTIENNAQLMIIGDANQTLYEFRNANPQFLNALERSDTFKTYTMSTNYRSKQQILSFANEFLNILETNATAKIKLHANKYETLTVDKFKNVVNLNNIVFPTLAKPNGTEYEPILKQQLENSDNLRNFVKEQIKNKKQIAIMAYRNKDTKIITDHVAKLYLELTNKTPKIGVTRNPTPNANTWLSSIASKYTFDNLKNQYKQKNRLTQQNVYDDLMFKLQNKADSNFRYTQHQIDDFAKQAVIDIVRSSQCKVYLNDLNNKKITFGRFIGYIKHTLINTETQHNSAVSRYFQQKPIDYKDADIIKTTIHSSKGLEFDSVICYFDETLKYSTTQENLRLYGVALTRAKEQELILNHARGTMVNDVIVQSPFGSAKSDMFKTPMRTAYARVLQELKASNKD